MAVRFSADGQDYTRTAALGVVTQFSVTCWVRLAADRNTNVMVWEMSNISEDDYAWLRTASDGTTLRFDHMSNSTVTGPYGARALTLNTWYWVGLSISGATGTMITRGAGDSTFTTSTWSGGPASGTNHQVLTIGESQSSPAWLNGRVAAFKHWSGAALTAAELEAEYHTYTPQRTANLSSWYPFTRAETVDYSGNGRHLTATGAGASTEDGPPISWRPVIRHRHRPSSVPAEVTPDVVTGTASIPTPNVSAGVTVHPGPILGTASIPTPNIFVGSSPPTNVQPGPILGTASIPTPTVVTVKNVSITPGLVLGVASIPTPSVSVPINPGDDLTAPGQLSYNGFRMGGGTPYSWQLLTGWYVDMPPLDSGDVPDPNAHGSMPGQKLSQSRIVTAEFLIKAPKDQIEQAADDFLAGLPVPEADEQLPLAVRVLDKILIGYGACTNRAAPLDKRTRLGHIKAAAQFTLARPELYSRELLSATVTDGGWVEVANLGNTRTKPLIRCPGPANGPELIVERDLPGGGVDLRVLEFDLEVGPTETLIIDPFNGTVSIGDVSKLRWRTGASVGVPDFVLGPGVSELSYSTAEGGAPDATVLWRHAHL